MAGINLNAQMTRAVMRDGNQTYEVIKMFTSQGVIWQTGSTISYDITDVSIVYSSGSAIPADGSGYAVIRGRVRIYKDGALVWDYGNQELQPHLPSGCDCFYLDGNKIKGYNRHKVEGPELSSAVDYSYGSSWWFTGGLVCQTANVKMTRSAVKTTTGYAMSFSYPSGGLTPDGAIIVMNGTRSFTLTSIFDYSSGESETVVETGRTESAVPTTVTIEGGSGATYSSGSVTVTNNYHNTSGRVWELIGRYDGFNSPTLYLIQTADSYSDSVVNDQYLALIGVGSGTITAAASTAELYVIASHRERTKRAWVYGEDQYLNATTVTDTPAPVKSGDANNRYSISGLEVTHASMGKNVTTDYVRYTITNGDQSAYVEFSVTNALGSVKYKNTSGTQGENIEAGSISSWGIPTKPTVGSGITAAGGHATISGSTVTNERTYNKTYYYRYTSGAYDDKHTDFFENRNEAGSVYYQLVNAAARYSIDDDVLYHNGMGRDETTDSCIVRAVNAGSSQRYQDSATVSVTNTRTSSTTHQHSCAIDYDEGEIPVNGGTYTVNYKIVKTVNSSWTSGESSSVTSDETASVTATNCTASVYSVTGTGSLTITVPKNTSSSSRNVSVAIGDAIDSRDQCPLVISSIVLSPATISGQRGSNYAIAAYANWTDGTQTNISSVATWSSTASGVAYYSSGRVYLSAVGTATVQASCGGRVGSCTVTVTAPVTYSLELSHTDVTMPNLGSFTQTVTLVGSDGSRSALSYSDLQITYGGALSSYVANYQLTFYFQGILPSSQQTGNIIFRYSAKNIEAYTHVTVKNSY